MGMRLKELTQQVGRGGGLNLASQKKYKARRSLLSSLAGFGIRPHDRQISP